MDWRNIKSGNEIPSEYYSDQPYIIQAEDGTWVCALTTGEGREGQAGQYILTMRSKDFGKTWSDRNRMEPKGSPENSYSVLLKTDFGRIYCFYNYNKDNLREVIANDPPFEGGVTKRVDSLGYYVFRYSDDNGITWSKERGEVPMRRFKLDMKNPYGGEILFFWNVGKPLIDGKEAYLSIHKVGELGEGFFVKSEGVLIKSDNIMYEPDMKKLNFETLPEGNVGLRAPEGGGAVSEEQSYVSLSDGSFFSVYRTIDGRAAYSYSRNKGKSWENPEYMPVKNPRAANFVWKLENGTFIYWFHNHGGDWYLDRNPVWCLSGIETDGENGRVIEWSQPEILLYDEDIYTIISYPDLIEEDGKIYITETEKDTARTHLLDSVFIEKMLNWQNIRKLTKKGLIFSTNTGSSVMPELEPFLFRTTSGAAYSKGDNHNGITIDLIVSGELMPDELIFDTRKDDGAGISLTVTAGKRVKFHMGDGRTVTTWESDLGSISESENHIAIIVDGGPKIIYFVINGIFNDGGKRQFGWGRFNPNTIHLNGGGEIEISNKVKVLRIYDRALMTVETIANFRSGN